MNIYESIAAIMQEIPVVGKEKKNQQQGFQYRGIDDVMNALQPVLAKYRVFVVPEVLEQKREERLTGRGGTLLYAVLRIRYTFFAEDGSSISAVVIGEGMDSGDKASNKAMAIGLKYAFFQVFCIPTEELRDPDGETPEESRPGLPGTCEVCGRPIRDARNGAGEVWEAESIAAYTRQRFGRALCIGCMNRECGGEDAR